MDEAPDPGGAAREQAARELVSLAAGLVFAVAVVLAQRAASDPDAARTWRMRAAKAAERCYARAARWCWGRAEMARLAYEQGRP